MELSTAPQWTDVIGLITIISAAIYSWIQIREIKKTKKNAAALGIPNLFLKISL